MRCFTAHRRDTGLFTEPEMVLVKEGFCWPAFFFTFLWALWHRMWLTAALILIAEVVVSVVSAWLDLADLTDFVLSLGIMLLIGYGANDWRRRSLGRRGFEEAGIVCGRDRDEAEMRFFEADRNEAMT